MARLGSGPLCSGHPREQAGCTVTAWTLEASPENGNCFKPDTRPFGPGFSRRHTPLWKDHCAAPKTPVAPRLPVPLTDPLTRTLLPTCLRRNALP